MEFDAFSNVKKDFNVVVLSKKYKDDLVFFISSYKLPFLVRVNSFEEEEKIFDFFEENDVAIVIIDGSFDYINIIKSIQETFDNHFTHFIVISENGKVSNDIFLENTLFIHPNFIISNVFANFFYQSLFSYISVLNNESFQKKYKKVRNEYNKEKNLNQAIFSHIKEGAIILNFEGKILFANKIAEYVLNFENKEYIKTQLSSYLRGEEGGQNYILELLTECIQKRKRIRRNMQYFFTKNENKIILNLEFLPIPDSENILFIFEDVSIQKRLWDEIFKRKNLETLGLISEGIVHDLNNQLTTILASVHILKEFVKDENIYDYIIDIENASVKSKNIITDFVSFYKGNIPVKRKGNVKEVIEELVHFIFRGSNINVSVSAESNLWEIEFNQSLIAQAIKNILVNAREAVSKSGNIIIKIGNQIIGDKNPYDMKSGKYIKITVEDDGIGIKKDDIEKIFEPNFSTKGKDRGLGLSIVKLIIEDHNGFISVSSRERVGTIFQIFLPVSENMENNFVTKKERKIIKDSNVLIIESDSAITKTLEKIFSYLNIKANFLSKFRVFENWEIINKKYDCLIIDTSNIDEKNIERFITKFREINNNIRTILLTHKHRFDVEKINRLNINAVIYKPFNLEDIGEILTEVL
ncbi:MAG: ATP-binding protein [Brevinematales bacterium]|nr:ATP-binding protein [Brevinematales bacterium]